MVTLPKNTIIDGVNVGGKSHTEAISLVRKNFEKELQSRQLKICVDDKVYTCAYPEISFRDNLVRLVKKIKKGGTYVATKEVYLLGIDEKIREICRQNDLPSSPAKAEFSAFGKPFKYTAEQEGRSISRMALKRDILNSINGDFCTVTAQFRKASPKVTLEKLMGETELISRYTTYYDYNNVARANNISLACAYLNGKVIGAGDTLSFNDTVGVRSCERGFLDAKIILNGEYVEGIGGGVCQVSTTLYNSAVLAGMEIVEYHPHSLKVEYVPPSRDAMVSGRELDLKIKNTAKTPIYMRANASKGVLFVELYGEKRGDYSIKSQVLATIPPKNENVDDELKIREGKEGVRSLAYLERTVGGKKTTTLLRKDYYLPISRRIYLPPSGDDKGSDT